MSDNKAPSRLESLGKVAIALYSELLVSYATGGVPNPAGAIAAYAEDAVARRRSKGEKLFDAVVDQVGEARLMEQLARDPERDTLMWDAIQTSMDSAFDNKRIYLARVVANAMASDEPVDEAHFIVSALKELDGPHIRALVKIAAADDANQADPGNSDEILQAELEAHTPPVLTALVRAGVVYVGSEQRGNGLFSVPRARTYSITGVNEFGRKLLKDLQSVELD